MKFGVSLVALLTVVSCSEKASNPKGHPLPASALISKCEPGLPGGELTLALPARPGTFNPLLVNDSAADLVARLLFASLVNIDWATLEPGPGLAESWSVAADNRAWTFKLRQGVRWSDGHPFTADDVLFTWNSVMLDPQNNRVSYEIFHPNGQAFAVEKVDDFTVRVTTPGVFAPMLEFFGTVAILPRHRLDASVREHRFLAAYASNSPPEAVIGNGPFRLKKVKADDVVLERNPEYWVADKKGQRLPYFDRVRIINRSVPGGMSVPARSEVTFFLNGDSDLFENVRPEMYPDFKAAANDKHFKLLDIGVGADREIFWFNQNTNVANIVELETAVTKPLVNPAKLKWFRNKKFRQAVSMAIDRDRIAREAYNGRALPMHGFISTENPRWNNTNVVAPPYDPARAKALLAEIGISDKTGSGVATDADGTPLEIAFISNIENPSRQKASAIIVENLKAIGIKLNYTPLPFRETQQKIDGTFNYEAALIGLGGAAIDPESQMNVLRSSQPLHQWFPMQRTPSTDWEARIDALMDTQAHTLDFAARKKAFDEIQTILADELPMIFTVSPIACAAAKENIANLRPAVLTPYRLTWNIEELYFRK